MPAIFIATAAGLALRYQIYLLFHLPCLPCHVQPFRRRHRRSHHGHCDVVARRRAWEGHLHFHLPETAGETQNNWDQPRDASFVAWARGRQETSIDRHRPYLQGALGPPVGMVVLRGSVTRSDRCASAHPSGAQVPVLVPVHRCDCACGGPGEVVAQAQRQAVDSGPRDSATEPEAEVLQAHQESEHGRDSTLPPAFASAVSLAANGLEKARRCSRARTFFWAWPSVSEPPPACHYLFLDFCLCFRLCLYLRLWRGCHPAAPGPGHG